MPVLMPAVVVLIVCKTLIAGPPDQNASFTKAENLEWATEHSMMVCRRNEVPLYDVDVDRGAAPRPFSPEACIHQSPMIATRWDAEHKSSQYRVWRVACPVRIVNTITGEIIGWSLPPCGHTDTVVCLVDTAI